MAGKITDLTAIGSIDRANDLLEIVDVSANASYNVTPNNLVGITTGSVVSTSDTQNISNKTFGVSNVYAIVDGNLTLENTSDNTKKVVFALSGITTGTTRTLTIPDASGTVVLTGATQTLTGKTITSPAISGGTIDNSTITVDALSGHTTSNTGTIYGVGVTAGQISGSSTVLPAALATGIQSSKLYNPYKFSVYRNAAQTPAAGLIGYDTKIFDTGTNFSTSTGLFTALIPGFYFFQVLTTFASGTAEVYAQPQYNGSVTGQLFINDYSSTTSATQAYSSSFFMQMSANDTIGITAGGLALAVGIQRSRFSGFLVSAT